MSMTDPIADLLTRIRNAAMRRRPSTDIPASRLKAEILKLMQREGFISGFERQQPEGGHPSLRVDLKYVDGRCVIEGLKRVSSPGLRQYVAKDEIPWVQGGYGIAVLSTSRGLLTDKEARRQGIGGEVLCTVW
ncbi:MAG: 30S ribosomal protein S8 [Nitrospirota bacterium]|nr:30S ribosomal protein S8 [Nitrospirota bacterium]